MRGARGIWIAGSTCAVGLLLWLLTAPSAAVFQPAEFPIRLPALPTQQKSIAAETMQFATESRTFTPPTHQPLDFSKGDPVFPAWLFWLVAATFLVVVLGSVAVMLWRWLRRAHDEVDADETDLDAAPSVPSALVHGSDAMRESLRRDLPSNAVVACWAMLEDAARQAGLPHRPHETSSEYTERILGRWVTDPCALRELAALYREARFSQHVLGEAERARASAALDVLLDQLRAAWGGRA